MTVGGAGESGGEWAFVWRASSSLHFQLIGLWGAAAGVAAGGLPPPPSHSVQRQHVRETEVD